MVLLFVSFWAAEDGVAGAMAASADMWKLEGTGGTLGCTVESEAYGAGPGLLAVRVDTRAVAVAVVGAGADNTVGLS